MYGDKLEDYAGFDYKFIKEHPNVPSNGALQCFCQSEAAHTDEATARSELFSVDGDEVQICDYYYSVTNSAAVMAQSISFFVIGFNWAFPGMVGDAVTYISYDTKSKELRRLIFVTFLCFFF